MATVRLHYWAGARAAAGVESEEWTAASVADALRAATAARADPAFARVVTACSVLVDGVVVRGADLERPVSGSVRAELLPPFAGG